MPEYNCERCLKDFKQKSHYNKHLNKKIPCQNIKEKVEKEVEKVISGNEDKEVDNKKKTKKELLLECEKLGFENYKSKKKSNLINMIEKGENNVDLKPIIKWSGGKSDEIKMFKSHIPNDYNIYIEPFIGDGSVFFNLKPEKAVITDIHPELIDFYSCIKKGQINEIYNFMEENGNNEESYYKIRDKMKIDNELDNAKRFYYQRKTCFRGMMRYNKKGKFNIPFGKYKTINYNDLKNKKYEELLKRTEIFNKSFEYVFEKYNDKKNFMFLDPPYDSEFTDYGYCKFGKEEQTILANLFKQTKIRCLMIIGKTEFIEDLYKDYIVGEYDKKYKFKIHSGRVGDEINTKHLIIKNYK